MFNNTRNMRSISPFTHVYARSLALLALFLIAALACTACQPGSSSDDSSSQPALTPVTEDLQMLAQKTIFFGHQSVGANIIQGMEDILPNYPEVQLAISHVADTPPAQTPAILHTEIGQNYDPLSKIQAFDQVMRDGMGTQADVAFFKFCYVDFNQDTDVDALFTVYKQTMADLARDYPETTLVHVTVPLMAQRTGFKAFFKNMAGRDNPSLVNLQRHQFNELVRQEYGNNTPIFDLAQIEARSTSKQPCSMTVNGQSVPCLYTPYTDDGEHLNEVGRKVVAEQLLMFLAKLP